MLRAISIAAFMVVASSFRIDLKDDNQADVEAITTDNAQVETDAEALTTEDAHLDTEEKDEHGTRGPALAQYWRVLNRGACGWRPFVTDFKMYSDAQRRHPFQMGDSRLLSSGDHGEGKEARRAIDSSGETAWRPQVHAPAAREVWIGYDFGEPVVVQAAVVRGLGRGEGGGRRWNGGLVLQSSEDGRSWHTVAEQSDSDLVTAPAVRMLAQARWEPLYTIGSDSTAIQVSTGTTSTEAFGSTESYYSEVSSALSFGFEVLGAFEIGGSVTATEGRQMSRNEEFSRSTSEESSHTHTARPQSGGTFLWQWVFHYSVDGSPAGSTSTKSFAQTGHRGQKPACLPGYASDPYTGYQHCVDDNYRIRYRN